MARNLLLLRLICAFFVLKLISSENSVTLQLLDKSEYLKRPKVKYHLYDPQLFLMYKECLPRLHRPSYASLKFNIFTHCLDINFVESIIALNESVDPSEATLFIIPVFYNQATLPSFPCHYHENEIRLIAQMYEVLHSLGHYKAGVRNHFLMADHWAAGVSSSWTNFSYEPELIVGRFEHPTLSPLVSSWSALDASQFIAVGYSTKLGVSRQCPKEQAKRKAILPLSDRKYLASFTGGLWLNDDERSTPYRTQLYFASHNQTLPNDIYISVYKKGEPFSSTNPRANGHDVMGNSLLCLSIAGDTPTTDRIWVAFEHLTLIGVLSVERERLLPLLPFPKRVPWEEMIVWIDTDAFLQNPVDAMRSRALALSDSEKERRVNLMKKHQRDVLWAYEESVAVLNVLEEANSLVKVLS